MAESKDSGAVKAAVAGAVATVVLTVVVGAFPSAWTWFKGVVSAVGHHLGMSSGWPNWMSYLLALIAVQNIVSLAMRWSRTRNDAQSQFTEFSFLGGKWRWLLTSGTPSSLLSFCPVCDGQLVYEETGDGYGSRRVVKLHCERCQAVRVEQGGNLSDLKGRVCREIERQLRTGEWRQSVPVKPE